MLPLFKMWIGEAEKDLGKLGFLEEVRQKLHSVGADAGYILVAVRCVVLNAEGTDFLLDILCN